MIHFGPKGNKSPGLPKVPSALAGLVSWSGNESPTPPQGCPCFHCAWVFRNQTINSSFFGSWGQEGEYIKGGLTGGTKLPWVPWRPLKGINLREGAFEAAATRLLMTSFSAWLGGVGAALQPPPPNPLPESGKITHPPQSAGILKSILGDIICLVH